MATTVRVIEQGDRQALEAALRSDETFRPDEIAVALELIDDALKGSDDYWVWVATNPEVEPAIAGYICYGPTPMTESTYDLYWIVSHVDARGRGVAGALLQHMEQDLRAKGATGIRVETSQLEGYGAARKFYAKWEYPEAGRLVDFYKPGDALITYYKRL